jgi:small subunit ribosomal protein S1
MSEEKNNKGANDDFAKLLDSDVLKVPKAGDTVKGTVLSASKAEVRLDVGGVMTGVVRGQELYQESEEYASLKPGDEVEATVIEEENENGEMELSFKYAGEAKVWSNLRDAFASKKIIKVKIIDANRGGLIVGLGQIMGFLPVSQLSPEKYPRVSGGDKSKILEKLKSYVGEEIEVKVSNLDEREKEEKIIFSEKDVWSEKQRDIISKYKTGTIVDGIITAIADFGVFVSFGENLEGLIHISELAWQRIDDPGELFKVGDKVKAEVININGSKIFLSAKKLIADPWKDVDKKFKAGQKLEGMILKVNPFGLFVKLDDDIHGLAHVSQLELAPGVKIQDAFKANEKRDFIITAIEPKEHRLGLIVAGPETKNKKPSSSAEASTDAKALVDKSKDKSSSAETTEDKLKENKETKEEKKEKKEKKEAKAEKEEKKKPKKSK